MDCKPIRWGCVRAGMAGIALAVGTGCVVSLPSNPGAVPSKEEMRACASWDITLGIFSAGTPEQPVAYYWPDGTFESGLGEHEFEQVWFTSRLCAMGEPRLTAPVPQDRTVIRFLWLRSFHPELSVRVAQERTGYWLTVTRLARPPASSPYSPGVPDLRQRKSLSTTEWEAMLEALAAARFWSLPTGDPYDGAEDGAAWIVEAVMGDRQHVVVRQSGRELEPLGRLMLDLTLLEPDPIY